jgi:outer membrane protein
MKRKYGSALWAVGFGVAAAFPLAAVAQDTGWAVRAGLTRLEPANKSDAIPALGVPADAIHVSAKTIPEIDVLYSFTKNWVGELVLTYPQKHTVTLSGTDIGTFKELPPTLLAQYHFMPGTTFDPYVGAGLNLTLISSVDLKVPGVGSLDLSKSSVGYALQLGADFNVDKQWFVNVDAKYVTIGADVKAGGATVSKVKVDPFLYSIGAGWRF